MRGLARVIEGRLPAATRLVAFRSPAHAATFYTGRVMRVVVDPHEAKSLIDDDVATALVIRRRDIRHLGSPLSEGIEEVWSNPGGMVLLANQAASAAARHPVRRP